MATPSDATATAETPADFGTDAAGSAQRWISEINLAEKDQAAWRSRCKRIIKKYRKDQNEAATDVKGRDFALLWSNIQTLAPAVYARTPTAVVGRRWKDDDPVGRLASEILERSINFSLDALDFNDLMTGIRDEYLLVGRAQAWVRYVPHMQTVEPTSAMPAAVAPGAGHPPGAGSVGEPDDDVDTAPDGEVTDSNTYEVVAWEEAIVDHVSWDDFLHSVARKWSEVRWVARIVYMTRDELVDRFPKCGKDIPLDHGPEDDKGPSDDAEQWKKAAIYEIWDKPSRKAIWVSKAYSQALLDERDDPLELKDFFPCPRPLLGTCGPDSLVPTPDYVYYQSQARDIDELTRRIGLLTDALKLKGFYAAGDQPGKDLNDLVTDDTNTLIPVDSWAAFTDKGGAKGLIEWIPLDMVASTLQGCIEARKQLIEDVYQITGIADIMRGDVDPDETATATRTKATWGSSRVRDKQKDLARFVRDVLRIMGQVVAGKFSPQTLAGMSNVQLFPTPEAKQQELQQLQAQAQAAAAQAQAVGQPPPPPQVPPQLQTMIGRPTWQEVEGLLRDNTLRTFRIDIESDSTIEPDDQDEKQRRIEFIEAVGEYVSKSIPAIQLMPQMLPVIAQGLLFLVRGFRVGREMEEVIEKALDQMQQAAMSGQMQQPPKPGPDPKVEQAKAQAAGITAQAKVMDAQTNQFRAQTDRYEAQAGAQIEGQRLQQEQADAHLDRLTDIHMQSQDIRADLQKAADQAIERRFRGEIMSDKPIRAPTQ